MVVAEIAEETYTIRLSETRSVFLLAAKDPCLIDTGAAADIETLRAGLRRAGVPPAELAHAVVSHVHLDHSGCAGHLVQDAPNLDVYIHDSTTDHLVDPTSLVSSTKRALGDEFESIGAPEPVPESNIVPMTGDQHALDLGTRSVTIESTPGHSPDHFSVVDHGTGIVFANEAIGRYYETDDEWVPPATVPNFDPEAVANSIEQLRERSPTGFGLSHVGFRPNPTDALDRAAARLQLFDERIPEIHRQTGDRAATIDRVRTELLDLSGYSESTKATQASILTRGFLMYYDRW